MTTSVISYDQIDPSTPFIVTQMQNIRDFKGRYLDLKKLKY